MQGNLKPARNVIIGFIGGAMAFGLLAWAKSIGYQVDPTIASALPAATVAILAHICDMVTGDNAKPN